MPEPPWRQATRQQQGRRSERDYARKHGGELQPNSGALPIKGKKGDIRQNGYLLDHKDAIGQKSYRIDSEEFFKLAHQAAGTPPGMLPAMIVQFEGLRLRIMRDDDYLAEKVANTN